MTLRGAGLVVLLLLCAAPVAAGIPLAPTSDVDSSLVPSGYPIETDGFGNVMIRFGSGKPVTLVAVRRDVPAYFVSSITADGYLRLQNQGTSPSPLWDQFQVGRRVFVSTRDGRVLPGVVAAPNTHFRRGDDVPIPEATVDDLWVDVGAESDREVRAMGIDVLSLVTQAHGMSVGEMMGPGASVIAGAWLADRIRYNQEVIFSAPYRPGSIVFAWVAQGSAGGRGAETLARRIKPDRAIVIGPLFPSITDTTKDVTRLPIGTVVISAVGQRADSLRSWAMDIAGRIPAMQFPVRPDPVATVLDRAGIQVLQTGVVTRYVGTPGEMTSIPWFAGSEAESERYLWMGWPPNSEARTEEKRPSWQVLTPLVRAQGISEHEDAVRTAVRALIPRGMNPTVDKHGNVVVRWGTGKPRRAFMAHMDEIGYHVTGIDDDGRLRVEKKGGFYDWLYEGEIVRRDGGRLAVVAPRSDYMQRPRPVIDSPLSDRRRVLPTGYKSLVDSLVRVDPGNSTRAESKDWMGAQITVEKWPARLGAHRVAGRSLDDRFGCTALILALQELSRSSPPKDGSVIVAFTVEEETGLKGAEGLADDLAAAGELPPVVHAVDTFVSSDTPLEDQRYGYAKLGKGMVIRTVDTGSAAPQAGVEAVKRVAAKHGIPLQFGITSGGNDGQMFSRWGSVNVPLGWPLRYSHTQVETADLRDLEALARMVTELARTKPGQE